jgi:hypothetical protein
MINRYYSGSIEPEILEDISGISVVGNKLVYDQYNKTQIYLILNDIQNYDIYIYKPADMILESMFHQEKKKNVLEDVFNSIIFDNEEPIKEKRNKRLNKNSSNFYDDIDKD